jgi:ABC-type nitrate/sulfonate/bicarbonate transport system permease component
LTLILYLPLAYLVTYVPLRAGLLLLTSRASAVRRLSARLIGLFLGVALAFISTHTDLFHYLNPILELAGL